MVILNTGNQRICGGASLNSLKTCFSVQHFQDVFVSVSSTVSRPVVSVSLAVCCLFSVFSFSTIFVAVIGASAV
ncbi:hypothetical protein M758_4G120300 [Ceratodon purpureus]|nr:hypothetical protein M758_4G120300 [Ceratodon purpureus]